MNWEGLLQNLGEQSARHRELLSLLRREEGLVENHTPEEAEEINRLRAKIAEAVERLELERAAILNAGLGGAFAAECGIRTLAERCGQREIKERLMASREELTGLMNEIRSQAKRNEIIVRGRKMALNALRENLSAKLRSTRLYSGEGKALNTSTANTMQRWI